MAAATIPQMPAFPGHVISTGSPDKNAVRSIQHRLNQLGCGPIGEDGSFGGKTGEAVHVFQSRSVDQFGTPLTVDGRVGPGRPLRADPPDLALRQRVRLPSDRRIMTTEAHSRPTDTRRTGGTVR